MILLFFLLSKAANKLCRDKLPGLPAFESKGNFRRRFRVYTLLMGKTLAPPLLTVYARSLIAVYTDPRPLIFENLDRAAQGARASLDAMKLISGFIGGI